MTKYAILIYDDPAVYANMSPEAWPAVVDAHSTFVEQVFALGGSLAGGEALAPPTTATTVKGAGHSLAISTAWSRSRTSTT